MKKIFLLLLFFISVKAFAQYPAPTGVTRAGNMLYFYKIIGPDTLLYGIDAFSHVYPIGRTSGGSGVNIYNSNGALTGDRTVIQGVHSLQFSAKNGSDSTGVNISPTGFDASTTDGALLSGIAHLANSASIYTNENSTGFEGTFLTESVGGKTSAEILVVGTSGHNKQLFASVGTGADPGIMIDDGVDDVGLIGKHVFPLSGDGAQYAQYHKVDSLIAAAGGGTTIYTGNGSLNSDRSINLASHNLEIADSGNGVDFFMNNTPSSHPQVGMTATNSDPGASQSSILVDGGTSGNDGLAQLHVENNTSHKYSDISVGANSIEFTNNVDSTTAFYSPEIVAKYLTDTMTYDKIPNVGYVKRLIGAGGGSFLPLTFAGDNTVDLTTHTLIFQGISGSDTTRVGLNSSFFGSEVSTATTRGDFSNSATGSLLSSAEISTGNQALIRTITASGGATAAGMRLFNNSNNKVKAIDMAIGTGSLAGVIVTDSADNVGLIGTQVFPLSGSGAQYMQRHKVDSLIAAGAGSYSAGLGLNLTGTVFKLDTAATHGAASKDFVFAAFNTKAQDAATYQPIGSYVTPSSTSAFTNKSGNISQWTNDSGYLTSLSGAAPTFTVTAPITYSSNVIGITQSDATHNGYLSGTDWGTFNSKQAALGFTPYNSTNPSNYIALTALSATSPIFYNSSTGVISSQAASGSQNGYLLSTDWTTFNGKQGLLTFDSTPTTSSTNPVTSGGVFTALGLKLNISDTAAMAYVHLAKNETITGQKTFSKAGIFQQNGITTTLTDAVYIQNNTATTSGATRQGSPIIHLGGRVWNTAAGGADNWIDGAIGVTATSGSNPLAFLNFYVGRSTSSTPTLSAAINFDSNGGINMPGGGSISTAGITMSGGLNATGVNFSFGTLNGGSTTANPAYIPASAAGLNYRSLFGGTTLVATAVGNYGGNVFFAAPANINPAASGTNPVLFNVGVAGFTFAASGATVTDAASLYIDAAPSGTATSTEALFIKNGNVKLGTAGQRLIVTEGSNGIVGQVALVAGTKAISISGVTTSTRAFITLVSPGSTTLTTSYQAVCTSGTLTLQANVAAGTINTADTSTLNYFIVN